jgi:hypothetical protein
MVTSPRCSEDIRMVINNPDGTEVQAHPKHSGNERRLHDSSDDVVAPHRLANELTADESVQSDGVRPMAIPHQPPRDAALTTTDRRLGKSAAVLILGVIVVGVVIAALLTRQWLLLGLAALVFIPFMLFLMAPFWLAEGTKIAQDDSVRVR